MLQLEVDAEHSRNAYDWTNAQVDRKVENTIPPSDHKVNGRGRKMR